jgi:DNA repair protein RecO (recombination protein O)
MAGNGNRFAPKEKRKLPARRMIATRAILLRRTRLTETSLVVHWLTAEAGRIKTVAKGARKPGGPFAGKLDLFYEDDILFARSPRSDLHALREAALVRPHEGLRLDVRSVALAAYFVELVELGTEPEFAVPEVYDLMARALRHLDGKPPTRRALEHFEVELAKHLGVGGEESLPPHERLAARRRTISARREKLLASLG